MEETIKRIIAPLEDYMYSKSSRLKIPLSGTFELSPVCNFACRMCYVRKTSREVERSQRRIRTLDDWLRIAEEAREAGLLYILLTGGEPLLWPDFWTLYERLAQMGFLVSVNTNGSLIDETAVEHFRKWPPKRINITLYGAGEETYGSLCCAKGAFHRVRRAIELLKKAGILVKLNCSLTPWNAQDLEPMIRYAEEEKLILQLATYMFPPVRRDASRVGENDRFTPEEAAYYRLEGVRLQYGEEKYRQFLEDIRKGYLPPPGLEESCIDPLDGKIRCRAGSASFWITWDGYLLPCGMMTEPAVDLEEGSFRDCWEKLVQDSEAVITSGICSRCGNWQLCHACAAMAFTETGKACGIPEYLCRTVEAMKRIAAEEEKKERKDVHADSGNLNFAYEIDHKN